MIGNGAAGLSLVDTRDVGRAMVWLGESRDSSGEVYLLRAFETSWMGLKEAIDRVRGVTAKVRRLPPGLAMGLARFLEWVTPYGGNPWLTRLAVRSMTANALFDDTKIRRAGFATVHNSLDETLSNAIADIEDERAEEPCAGQKRAGRGKEEIMTSWLYLIGAIVLEVAGTTSMKLSEGSRGLALRS